MIKPYFTLTWIGFSLFLIKQIILQGKTLLLQIVVTNLRRLKQDTLNQNILNLSFTIN
ncbi:MAG: hypothetical protein JWR50_2432 [Mucilaginibacter sp.]|nr:hypothetical protein [Mucilaginibacter sp.]